MLDSMLLKELWIQALIQNYGGPRNVLHEHVPGAYGVARLANQILLYLVILIVVAFNRCYPNSFWYVFVVSMKGTKICFVRLFASILLCHHLNRS